MSDAWECWCRRRGVAVGKAAEVGAGLAEADAVEGEGAGCHCLGFSVVGRWRDEVLDEGGTDVGARGSGFERGVHRSERGCDGSERVSLNGDLLRDVADRQRDRNILILPRSELHGAAVDSEARGRNFNGVTTGRKAPNGEVTLNINLDAADVAG